MTSASIIPFPGSPTAKIEDACREIRALRDRKLAEMQEAERIALLASIERDAKREGHSLTGQGS